MANGATERGYTALALAALVVGFAASGCGGTANDHGPSGGAGGTVDAGQGDVGLDSQAGSGGAAGVGGGGAGGPACVAAGRQHSCARGADGTLSCWGDNSSGQMGGSSTQSTEPSPIEITALGANVVEVATAWYHTCARKSDGSLWCWGSNAFGQLGDGTTSPTQPSPVEVTTLGKDVVQVATGWDHTCARKGDGTLWCWGRNLWGQLGDGTTLSKAQPVEITALGANVVQVATGGFHTCARKDDGSLWCWGHNASSQLGEGAPSLPRLSPVQVTILGASVVEVATGESYTCARKGDGTLWCWGRNDSGQLGDGTTAQAPESSPVEVKGVSTNSVGLVAGWAHTCARKTDGTLWCWGANSTGAVGDGTTAETRPTPVQVKALGTDVLEVSAGDSHTCARKGDGTLWCWGANSFGQVGDGTGTGTACLLGYSDCRPSPVKVAISISCP